MKLHTTLIDLLKTDSRFVDDDGEPVLASSCTFHQKLLALLSISAIEGRCPYLHQALTNR